MTTIYNLANGGVRGLRIAWQCEEMGPAYRGIDLSYPVPDDYRACKAYVARATARPAFPRAHADQLAHFAQRTEPATFNAASSPRR